MAAVARDYDCPTFKLQRDNQITIYNNKNGEHYIIINKLNLSYYDIQNLLILLSTYEIEPQCTTQLMYNINWYIPLFTTLQRVSKFVKYKIQPIFNYMEQMCIMTSNNIFLIKSDKILSFGYTDINHTNNVIFKINIEQLIPIDILYKLLYFINIILISQVDHKDIIEIIIKNLNLFKILSSINILINQGAIILQDNNNIPESKSYKYVQTLQLEHYIPRQYDNTIYITHNRCKLFIIDEIRPPAQNILFFYAFGQKYYKYYILFIIDMTKYVINVTELVNLYMIKRTIPSISNDIIKINKDIQLIVDNIIREISDIYPYYMILFDAMCLSRLIQKYTSSIKLAAASGAASGAAASGSAASGAAASGSAASGVAAIGSDASGVANAANKSPISFSEFYEKPKPPSYLQFMDGINPPPNGGYRSKHRNNKKSLNKNKKKLKTRRTRKYDKN